MPLSRSSKWVSGLRPTQETGSNPKDDLGLLKVPLGLISQSALVLQALCMQDGSEKYGPYNYRVSKVQALIYLEACLRHLGALIDGEDFDQRTGKPHIGYVLATAQIFADAWVNGHLIDNRPLPGSAGALISLFSREPGEPEPTAEELRAKLIGFIASKEPQVCSATPVTTQENGSSKAVPEMNGKFTKRKLPRRVPKLMQLGLE